ncbi:MAG: hypothetical protein H6R07_1040 [Proteobacteria bacterium]|nr:hypothetical protein [Pseudomonadota bacterium]
MIASMPNVQPQSGSRRCPVNKVNVFERLVRNLLFYTEPRKQQEK